MYSYSVFLATKKIRKMLGRKTQRPEAFAHPAGVFNAAWGLQ